MSRETKAQRKARMTRERELADVTALLELPAGRRFLWRLMGLCSVFGSVASRSGDVDGRIHYRTGQQDIGHLVLAEIQRANPQALIAMMAAASQEIEQ